MGSVAEGSGFSFMKHTVLTFQAIPIWTVVPEVCFATWVT